MDETRPARPKRLPPSVRNLLNRSQPLQA
jgi:hypothetical protein